MMKLGLFGFLAFVGIVFCGDVSVTLPNGMVLIGDDTSPNSALHIFRGIPFATPPIGPNRWKSPTTYIPTQQDLAGRQAKSFSAACSQFASGNTKAPSSEDCLYLNIWRPSSASPTSKLPVLVWIFGGAFMSGKGSDTDYDGSNLSLAGNMIVVNFNYRLGVFGYLSHPLLRSENPLGTTGNYGIQDQTMALKWVKENIASFGGDPDKITIQGESAGSISVCLQLVTPFSTGLFNAAVMESGPCDTNTPSSIVDAIGAKFFATVNPAVDCNPSGNVVTTDCLRAIPEDRIMALAYSMGGYDLFGPNQFIPSNDGVVVPQSVLGVINAGQFRQVPLMIGHNKDEATLFVFPRANWFNIGQSDYDVIRKQFSYGDMNIYNHYDPINFGMDRRYALTRLFSEAIFICGTRRLANLIALKSSAPVYQYAFNLMPSTGLSQLTPLVGAFHFAEVPFFFGNLPLSNRIVLAFGNQDEINLHLNMQSYLVRFVNSINNPNAPTATVPAPLIEWPRHNPAASAYAWINFDKNITTTTDKTSSLNAEACDLYDNFFFSINQLPEFVHSTPTPSPPPSGSATSASTAPSLALAALLALVLALYL